jgi:hypothetical protein
LIQRFGSALNLNVHFHMLFLDGVYVERPDGSLRFRWVKAPISAELAGLTQTLVLRIGRYLERQGLLDRDAKNSYLAGDDLEAGPMEQLLGSWVMCIDARMSRAQDAQDRPPTASPSGRRSAAMCVHCGRCRPVMSPSMTGSARLPRSPCTPVWQRRRIKVESSSGRVGI